MTKQVVMQRFQYNNDGYRWGLQAIFFLTHTALFPTLHDRARIDRGHFLFIGGA
jgi:hypothetical protein